jgi:hypothetical protein
MTENIHPRSILITVRVGGMISPILSRGPGTHPSFQSLHFANRNRPKSLKTSRQRIFNRYTFRRFRAGSQEAIPLATQEHAKGEEKSNRDNPTFKNRRNPMNPNDITFSNRDKNTCFASPLFRPADPSRIGDPRRSEPPSPGASARPTRWRASTPGGFRDRRKGANREIGDPGRLWRLCQALPAYCGHS